MANELFPPPRPPRQTYAEDTTPAICGSCGKLIRDGEEYSRGGDGAVYHKLCVPPRSRPAAPPNTPSAKGEPPAGYYTVGDEDRLVNEPYFVTLTRIEHGLRCVVLMLGALLALEIGNMIGRVFVAVTKAEGVQ